MAAKALRVLHSVLGFLYLLVPVCRLWQTKRYTVYYSVVLSY